ncbi:MAG TPA: glycoside hydrolase family 20 zincin-like fold domain-containing protein [Candidatus Mediterraneibacter intestinipullorum]|nr:glycoside hydrolase family 20 zincin-like fold domain-containing protein [Candidatus Mediterraneibacter intestinipullorum]
MTVNFRISKGTETRETGAYTVEVPGKKSISEGNEKPVVIPEVAEWDGGNGEFTVTDISRIVINPAYDAALSFMEAEFKADYQDITGREIEIVSGTEPGTHDFYFTLGSSDQRRYVLHKG